jgi:hypothetical protein
MKGPIAKNVPVPGVYRALASGFPWWITAKTVAEMPRFSQIGFFHLSA